MKRLLSPALISILVAAALAAGYWWGARTAPPQTHVAAAPASEVSVKQDPGKKKLLYYRNPMGLPDTSQVPKKDPMGMDYIPVYEGEEADRKLPAGTVRISLDKVQLLGVRTEPVSLREMRRTVHAVGTIQANERLLYKVAPRFEGWIEKLHVNTTGQAVARGQPLMEVYSPDLLTAQEEYLIALRGMNGAAASGPEAQAVMQRLAESVLRRLRNWEISDEELQALRQEGKPRRVLAYRSPVSGVVLQKPGTQGMRFMPGEVLYEIADLSSVWMLAEVFEQDLGLVRVGQEATLRIVAYPDRAIAGKVVFIYPAIDPDTRTARVRIELPNPTGLLKPAMYGNVELASDRGKGKTLAVPETAVLDSGTRQLVLVRRGEGLFEPRTVKLGVRADGYAGVMEGLQAGEEVVVRANFLIDAESNLKAALETFGGHGGEPAKSEAAKPAAAPGAQIHKAKGRADAVDHKAGTIEITHDPIPSLNWPAMAMKFQVKDAALLKGVEPGQAVEFDLVQKGPGEFVIERIARAGGRAAPKAAAARDKGH